MFLLFLIVFILASVSDLVNYKNPALNKAKIKQNTHMQNVVANVVKFYVNN